MSRPASGLLTAVATGFSLILAPTTALAAPAGHNVVINEVYGGGGNSGSVYSHDFIELYNPTGEDIDLAGWALDQRSAADNRGTLHTITEGVIPAGGHFLVRGAAGNSGTGDLPTPDSVGTFNFSGTNAIAELLDASATAVDLVGWGSATRYETSPAQSTTNATSTSRVVDGADTDDNGSDFARATPSPVNSGGTGPVVIAPEPEPEPEPQPGPGVTVSIAEIQGTGDATPYQGREVTTGGVVTAVYPEGGRNGFHLQTGGTGGAAKLAGEASDAIFVHLGSRTSYPEIGDSVIVTGQAQEYYDVTQISGPTLTAPDTDFEPVSPVEIDHLPAGEEAREAYESMLVLPTGAHTVTDNYSLNTYGEIGLAPGTRAHRQPTDVHSPDTDPASPAQQLAGQQQAELVLLDDGRTRNYMNSDQNTPLPYVAADGGPHQSVRTGAAVDFRHPVVVGFSHDHWRFQPTTRSPATAPPPGCPSPGRTPGPWRSTPWTPSRATTPSPPSTS